MNLPLIAAPDGYTEDHDSSTWNIGYVFRYSAVYGTWLDCGIRLTVKPNMTISEAFANFMDHPMWIDYNIFFVGEL